MANQPADKQKSTVNSLAFVDADAGSHVEYDGPFKLTGDAGSAEVSIPVDPDDYAGIYETTAENLAEREGDIAVAIADAAIEITGRIESADVVEDELIVRIDDGNRVSASDVDIDREAIEDV